MSRTSTLVGTSRPLAFALLRVHPAIRQLAGTRVHLAGGLLALALLAFIGIVRAPVFVDEADNIVGACQISRGAVAYRDFFSHHFPAPYYALAAFREPAACSVLAGRVLGILSLTLAAGLFAWAARNALAPVALLMMALTAPLYYVQLYLAETFICVGLILSLSLLTDRGRQLHGPAGFWLRFGALAVLSSSSPLGLMMAALLMPLIVLGSGRPFTPVISACAAAVLAWPLALAVQGALPAFVEQGIAFNTGIYSHYLTVQLTNPVSLLWETLNFARHRFSFGMDWLMGQEMKATAASFGAAFELLILTLLGVQVFVRREERLFRLGVCLLLPLAVSRDGFHLSPFVALATFGCAQLLPSGVTRRWSFPAVLSIVVLLVALRVYFFSLPVSLGESDELAESLKPTSQVQRRAAPDDAVLYLPIAPQGYLADERRPGSFYTYFLPWVADVPGAQDRLIADIEQQRVAVIVLDQDSLIWDRYRFSEYAPRVHAHIMATYRPADSSDRRKARIFVRAAP